jgi:hypothetical protein
MRRRPTLVGRSSVSRRLHSLLVAALAVTAVATTTAAAARGNVATSTIAPAISGSATSSLRPNGAPVLSVYAHGRSTVGSDGTLFIRTDTPGSLDVVGVAPAGSPRSDPGSFSLVATNAPGWDAAPLVSPGPALLSRWHWQAGASSLEVSLSYRGPDGSASPVAVQSIVAVSVPPTVRVEPVTGQPNTTTAGLSWTDTDGIGPGIVEREILREEAPATTHGCGEWTRGVLADVSAGEAASGALAISDLSLGHCYRFTVVVTDALGLAGQATTPVYVPGLLDPHGRPLPAWTGKVDIFRASAFASQRDFTWCVAASTQMMVNLILGTSDDSSGGQKAILEYARDNDELSDSGAGAGLIGWQGALDKFSGTPYKVEESWTLQGAINLAALHLRLTNRPVGLAVKDTTHAWVMTGFEATADPAFDPAFKVTAVYVSGPLYPKEQSRGYDMAPDTRIAVSDLGRYFTPVEFKGGWAWEFVAPLP